MTIVGFVFMEGGNRSKAIVAMQSAIAAVCKALSLEAAPRGIGNARHRVGTFE
jgi:hypothetical protein